MRFKLYLYNNIKLIYYIYAKLSGWRDSNPHALWHNILSVTWLPITSHPELKHPNDFRSHICRFSDRFIALSARTRKNLIYILASSSQLYRIRLLYNAPQLEMLFVGRGGFEPPKPKHLIYSQAHLTALVPSQNCILSSIVESNHHLGLGKAI